jgi:hypothetical protein
VPSASLWRPIGGARRKKRSPEIAYVRFLSKKTTKSTIGMSILAASVTTQVVIHGQKLNTLDKHTNKIYLCNIQVKKIMCYENSIPENR